MSTDTHQAQGRLTDRSHTDKIGDGNTQDVGYFRKAGCDIDHDVVIAVAEVMDRLLVINEHHSTICICNLKKLNEVEIREHNQFKIQNRFAALENFDKSGATYRSSNNIRTPTFQLKNVYFSMNGSSIKHGLMNNDHSLSIKGSSLNCRGCMIQVIIMQIICTLQDVKLVDITETNSGNFGQVKLMNLKQTIRTRISKASPGHQLI